MSDPRSPSPDPLVSDPHATRQPTAPDYVAAGRIGQVISDRYRIVELVAAGGMGSVFKAEHLLLRKWMAIKLLHPESQGFPEHMARFEREAIAGAHIQHPNIASATDFGVLPDGSNFLVLEYVRGVTLDLIIRQGPMPPPRAAEIARQIAAALAAAHERGVIHRDLKPRNILIEQGTDAVKVIDFGLAKVPLERLSTTDSDSGERESITRITLNGTVFGTPAYMAPEAAGGMDQVEARSDLYALGLILYEMLAGKHPFDGIRAAEIFLQHCTATPPPIAFRTPGVDVPRELETLVMCLLRKDPATRYATAGEVVEALDVVMPRSPLLGVNSSKDAQSKDWRSSSLDPLRLRQFANGPTGTPSVADLLPQAPRARSRRGWALAAAAAVLIAVVGVALALRFHAPSDPSSAVLAPSALASGAAANSAPGAPSEPGALAGADGSATGDAERLVQAAKAKNWTVGEEALFTLIDKSPASFERRDVMTAAAAVAVKSAFRTGGRGDQLFDALANRLGTDGLDVAYEIVSGYGGTRAAARASELLRSPEALKRASVPLRIAVELREASCRRKESLFDRAAQEGDARALVSLEMLRSPQCQPRIGQCCFNHNPKIERALSTLRARLRN